MKVIKHMSMLIILLFIRLSLPTYGETTYTLDLTEQERTWLEEHKNNEFVLGLDPYAGMEYFVYNEKEYGFALDLERVLERDLNIKVSVTRDQTWGEVYEGLRTGEVDILLGANETPERLEFMSFTTPLYRIPYAILAKKKGDIHTLGDIDNKKVGFIEGDIVIELFSGAYKNIDYIPVIFESQNEALDGLESDSVDAIISSGGSVVFDYMDQYPGIKLVTEVKQITSDMTLSTLKKNQILANILNKEIHYLEQNDLEDMIQKAKQQYNYKVMKLTPRELEWIQKEEVIVAGVPHDYLPIDYYEDGQYKGMAGSILKSVGEMTGIRFVGVDGEFSELMDQIALGDIKILNMAKTDDRQEKFYFTEAFSYQRDIIIGRKTDPYVVDIYGLEGKKVAVIDGFWHDEHLKRNLLDPQIVYTQSIAESLKAVSIGKADYMIENGYVAQFYIDEFELFNLVQRGNTSMDSYLYFGISKDSPELASIINKSLRFIDLDKVMRDGLSEVPHTSQKENIMRWIIISVGLVVLLLILGMILVRVSKDLIESKATTAALKEKEKYIYEDAMTKLYNRHYLYFKVEPHIDKWVYPQSVVICDLNNLKSINDKHGHAMGDALLKTFGKILEDVFPNDSIIVRTGGDEFLIVLLDTKEDQTKEYTLALEENCKNINISNNGDVINPSAAIGIASRVGSRKSFEVLIKEADDRMYEHKRSMKK